MHDGFVLEHHHEPSCRFELRTCLSLSVIQLDNIFLHVVHVMLCGHFCLPLYAGVTYKATSSMTYGFTPFWAGGQCSLAQKVHAALHELQCSGVASFGMHKHARYLCASTTAVSTEIFRSESHPSVTWLGTKPCNAWLTLQSGRNKNR